MVAGDEERNDGLVELVEEVAGEAAGGEDDGGNVVEKLASG